MEEGFPAWLKRSRKALDLTQLALAQRVGCSESTLRKIESGRLRPSRQFAERMAVCLEIPAAQRTRFIEAARRHSSPLEALDETLHPGLSPTPPAPRPDLLGFPTPLVPLIGRAHDVRVTVANMHRSEVRLLTLVGPPGVGKTRLAMQAAVELHSNFVDGVCFVSLAAAHSFDFVLDTIARSLGVREHGGSTIAQALASFLREKQLLLVLDNLEQLAAACAPLTSLLHSAPRLKLLCTSRVVLHLDGEHSYRVQPLALPEPEAHTHLDAIAESPAVALFVARARATHHTFALTPATAALVVRLCHRLDGLPLALELAAAQLRLLSIGELLNQLDRLGPLRLLRASPSHWTDHKTLWTMIAASTALLSEPARRVLQQLAHFPSGCTIDAALAVCTSSTLDTATVLHSLGELVDASLLQRTDGPTQESWLSLLETIRAFALEQEAEHSDDQFVERQLAYYCTLAETIASAVIGPGQRAWIERIVAEQPNIRVVLAHSLAAADEAVRRDGLRIAAALWWGWWACGYGAEAQRWLAQALDAAPGTDVLHARAWYAAGALACLLGDPPEALPALERALTLARANGNQGCEAHTLIFCAVLTAFGGDPTAGARLNERSIELFRAADPCDAWGLGLALMSQRMLVIYQRDYQLAQAAAEEALTLFTALGQPYAMALALNSLGDIARSQDDDLTAVDYYRRAIRHVRESGVVGDLPSMLHNCAYAELRCGELELAAGALAEALALSQRADNTLGVAECLTGCAGLAVRVGEPLRAANLFSLIAALYPSPDGPQWPPERREYEHYRAAAQAHLSSFDQVQTAGARPAQARGSVIAETIAWLRTLAAPRG